MSPRGFAILLLAVAGALTGHWIGTTVAAPAELVDHSYLGLTGTLVTPLAVGALGWLGLRGARSAGIVDVGLGTLLILQTAIFLSQELVELTSAGLPVSRFFAEPAILVGLAAQLPIAFAVRLALRWARRLAAVLIDTAPSAHHSPIAVFPSVAGWRPQPIPVRVRGPRGPPRLR